MPRSVKEWKGKTDDAAIPISVKSRIVERQRGRCLSCTREFNDALPPEFDHELPLAVGGEHREGNLRALCCECHGTKTKADASVIARTRRIRHKRYGLKKAKKKWRPDGYHYDWAAGRYVKDE